MANPRYHCIIPGCQETRTNKNFLNHVFSHSLESFPKSLVDSLKFAARGPLWTIRVKTDGEEKRNSVCLGCKRFFYKLGLSVNHGNTCPKKQEHKSFCQSFLGATSVQAPPVVPEILQSDEIAKLKKEIESLKRMMACDKKIVDKADETEATLHNILDYLNDKHVGVYQEVIEYIKQNNEDIIHSYLKN